MTTIDNKEDLLWAKIALIRKRGGILARKYKEAISELHKSARDEDYAPIDNVKKAHVVQAQHGAMFHIVAEYEDGTQHWRWNVPVEPAAMLKDLYAALSGDIYSLGKEGYISRIIPGTVGSRSTVCDRDNEEAVKYKDGETYIINKNGEKELVNMHDRMPNISHILRACADGENEAFFCVATAEFDGPQFNFESTEFHMSRRGHFYLTGEDDELL